MQETLHYLLMSDHLMIQKALVSSVKDTGLTPGQPKILDYLLHHDGAIQKEIAMFCHIEPASLTTILNGMEKKAISSENLLKTIVARFTYISPNRREYADRLNLEFAKIESKALKGFSETSKQQLYDLLGRIYQNMVNINKKEGTNK